MYINTLTIRFLYGFCWFALRSVGSLMIVTLALVSRFFFLVWVFLLILFKMGVSWNPRVFGVLKDVWVLSLTFLPACTVSVHDIVV